MSRTFAPPVYRALLGVIIRETDKALHLKVHAPKHKEHDSCIWFPLSQIASVHRTYHAEKGTFDVIMASEWILGTKGMLDAIVPGNPGITKEYVAMANTSKQEKLDNTLDDEAPVDDVKEIEDVESWWAQMNSGDTSNG